MLRLQLDEETGIRGYAAARRARFLDVDSLPLGVLRDAACRTHRVRSIPGALPVLYTDGTIEHSSDVAAGEELFADGASGSVAIFEHGSQAMVAAGRKAGLA